MSGNVPRPHQSAATNHPVSSHQMLFASRPPNDRFSLDERSLVQPLPPPPSNTPYHHLQRPESSQSLVPVNPQSNLVPTAPHHRPHSLSNEPAHRVQYLQRNPSLEAQIHSNQELFMHHINELHSFIYDMRDEIERISGENVMIKAEIDAIHQRVQDSAVNTQGSSKKAVRGVSNKHPELKPVVHAMFWWLINIDHDLNPDERHAKMTDGHESEAFFNEIDNPAGGRMKIWKPNYALAANTQKNKAFITEIVDRYNRNQSTPKLPDASFDKTIIRSSAQTYFATVATNWRKMRTDEGKQQLEDIKGKKKLQARREVTKARRDVVAEFEEIYDVKGAAALLDTDFASSLVSLGESDISDTTRAQRKKQGGRKGDWMVCGKAWHRKSYVRFLRELDRLIALKLAAATEKKTDGQAPKKRKRQTARKTTPRFHGNISKASNRPPASTKNPPIVPIAGMVKRSWNAMQEEKVVTLANPAWWGTWEEKADSLDSDAQDALDELPTDSDSEMEVDPVDEP
ncbi:hypothetical protein B0H13DRAFT_2348926 [Mycena leptocephala]|nr:hypothetical protein B0H13DRAFT_2348926 [Mycena leptocephala]